LVRRHLAPLSIHFDDEDEEFDDRPAPVRTAARTPSPVDFVPEPQPAAARVSPRPVGALKPGKREVREAQVSIFDHEEFQFPPLSLLAEPKRSADAAGPLPMRWNRTRGFSKRRSMTSRTRRDHQCAPRTGGHTVRA